jgi:hypothetical protein
VDVITIRIVVCSLVGIAALSLGGLIYLDAIGKDQPHAIVSALQVSIGCLIGIIVQSRPGRDDQGSRFQVAPPPAPPAKV